MTAHRRAPVAAFYWKCSACALLLLAGLRLAQGNGQQGDGERPKQAIDTSKGWKEKYSLSLGETVSTVAFAPDGKTFATGSDSAREKRVRIFDAETGKELSTLPFQSAAIKFFPDGKLLAIGVQDKVILWDLKKKGIAKILPGFRNFIYAMDISKNGKILAASDLDSAIVFDVDSGKPIMGESQPGKTLNAVALSADGTLLASGYGHYETVTDPGELTIWSVAKNKLLHRLPQPAGEIVAVIFLPGNATVVSGGISNQAQGPPKGGTFFWDTQSGARSRLLPEHDSEARVLATCPNAEVVASAGAGAGQAHDGVHLWNFRTKKLVRSLRVPLRGIWSMSFSPDGKYLAVGGWNGKLIIFANE